MNSWRFAIFITLVLTIWGIMHSYVFWRLGTIPWVAAHSSNRVVGLTALALWLSYPLARMLTAWKLEVVGVPLEFAAAVWMGVLFLMFATLLVVDVVTVGGLLFSQIAPQLRGGAVLVAGIFAVTSIVQGSRAPVVQDYEVRLADLPPERDGLTLVAISDLHLGTLKGKRWLTKLLGRINDMKPDMVGHDIPALVAAKLLKPLGNPAANSIKFFATADLLESIKDRNWLVRVSATIYQHWHKKNAVKKNGMTVLASAGHGSTPVLTG